jgi:hypothetical protein
VPIIALAKNLPCAHFQGGKQIFPTVPTIVKVLLLSISRHRRKYLQAFFSLHSCTLIVAEQHAILRGI